MSDFDTVYLTCSPRKCVFDTSPGTKVCPDRISVTVGENRDIYIQVDGFPEGRMQIPRPDQPPLVYTYYNGPVLTRGSEVLSPHTSRCTLWSESPKGVLVEEPSPSQPDKILDIEIHIKEAPPPKETKPDPLVRKLNSVDFRNYQFDPKDEPLLDNYPLSKKVINEAPERMKTRLKSFAIGRIKRAQKTGAKPDSDDKYSDKWIEKHLLMIKKRLLKEGAVNSIN